MRTGGNLNIIGTGEQEGHNKPEQVPGPSTITITGLQNNRFMMFTHNKT